MLIPETAGGTGVSLAGELRRVYGGDLALAPQALYANFVQSVDGVVSLPGVVSPGSVISGKSPADRFVMGLLRAAADAVLVGAGTLRDTPGHHWTAEHIFPDLAGEWAALRSGLDLPARPRLVVVTASGAIDVAHPAIEEGATIITTEGGAARLTGILPGTCDLRAWPGERVPIDEAVTWLRAQGHARILSEAGPGVMGQLLDRGIVGDLFLTVSPVFAGRDGGGRLGMVEGLSLLPGRRIQARLTGVRRGDDYLLLRYAI